MNQKYANQGARSKQTNEPEVNKLMNWKWKDIELEFHLIASNFNITFFISKLGCFTLYSRYYFIGTQLEVVSANAKHSTLLVNNDKLSLIFLIIL
jgi:hypothetical protein